MGSPCADFIAMIVAVILTGIFFKNLDKKTAEFYTETTDEITYQATNL